MSHRKRKRSFLETRAAAEKVTSSRNANLEVKEKRTWRWSFRGEGNQLEAKIREESVWLLAEKAEICCAGAGAFTIDEGIKLVTDMIVGKRGAKSQAREPTDRRIVK